MKVKFRSLLESAPGKASPGIVVRDSDSDRVLAPVEINGLSVSDLQRYRISLLGTPLSVRKCARGHYGSYDGSVKVTDFAHAGLKAHSFLREAYDSANRIRASVN
jgi:hypothetical protein